MRRIAKAFLSFAVIFSMLAALLPQTVAADVPSMKFGTMSFTSTMGEARTLTDSYYYSDDWFGEDPGGRNDSLALMSMQLVAGAVADLADVGDVGDDARAAHELALRGAGDDLREGGLAAAGRTEEDDVREAVRLDDAAEELAGPEDVRLSGDFLERARPHARRQRL